MPGMAPSKVANRGKRPTEKEKKLDLTIIMNLMVILIPALLAQQVTEYARHDVEFPTQAGPSKGGEDADEPQEEPPEQINLKLQLNTDQSVMIIGGKAIGTDGQHLVPADGAVPDYEAISEALAEEKDGRPKGKNYADPDQITIVAPTSFAYQDIIKILDVVRFHPTKEIPGGGAPADMFPIISLSPGSIG